jgi:hypothetical protein
VKKMLAIATKLTKINYDYEKLLEINKNVSKSFDYHVIDAETTLLDENILENLKKAVLTVQSKRMDSFELLEKYASYDFDICVVLGNKAYLSKKESNFQKTRILDILEKAITYENKIWVGTEGVENIVKNFIEKNDLISYYVYGCENPEISSKKAVYIPYVEKMDENILNSMKNYLGRRENYHGNWQDFIVSLDDLKNEDLNKIKDHIIVGYPINQDYENILNFKNKFLGK